MAKRQPLGNIILAGKVMITNWMPSRTQEDALAHARKCPVELIEPSKAVSPVGAAATATPAAGGPFAALSK